MALFIKVVFAYIDVLQRINYLVLIHKVYHLLTLISIFYTVYYIIVKYCGI